MRPAFLFTALVALAGCAPNRADLSARPEPAKGAAGELEYSVTVPTDLPTSGVGKSQREHWSAEQARQLYAASHREGWRDCLKHFAQDMDMRESSVSKSYVVTQEWNFEENAYRTGFHDCWDRVKALCEKLGPERTQAMVRDALRDLESAPAKR
jgi:hypothetical protein